MVEPPSLRWERWPLSSSLPRAHGNSFSTPPRARGHGGGCTVDSAWCNPANTYVAQYETRPSG
eukprot:1512145-Pyramimonas_sp.AAC.1